MELVTTTGMPFLGHRNETIHEAAGPAESRIPLLWENFICDFNLLLAGVTLVCSGLGGTSRAPQTTDSLPLPMGCISSWNILPVL